MTTARQLNLFNERSSTYRRPPDLVYCRWAVPNGGRSIEFHQCARTPVVWQDGIGLCRQHAKQAGWEVSGMARAIIHAEGPSHTTVACGRAWTLTIRTTDDPQQVTCQRCRIWLDDQTPIRLLGEPIKE